MTVLLLLVVGLCLCWLIYKVTIHALPCLVGLGIGQLAYASGAGWSGATLVGLVSAIAFFLTARAVFVTISCAPLRWLAAFAFVGPTLVLAYNIGLDALGSCVPSEIWRQLIAAGLAIVAGGVALVRLVEPEADGG
jgi:hypothetical protein